MKTTSILFGIVASMLCWAGGTAPPPEPIPAPTPPPLPTVQDWICDDRGCRLVPRLISRRVETQLPMRPVQIVRQMPTVQWAAPVQPPMQLMSVQRTYRVPRTEWVEEEREVTVMRPVKEMRTFRVPQTVYEEKVVTEQVPQPMQSVMSPPIVQSAPVMQYGSPCECPPQATYGTAYEGDIGYLNEGPVYKTRQTTRRLGPIRSFLNRRRAARLGFFSMRATARPVYQPSGQTLSWHLRVEHGIDTRGMSYAQMLNLHTRLHS